MLRVERNVEVECIDEQRKLMKSGNRENKNKNWKLNSESEGDENIWINKGMKVIK